MTIYKRFGFLVGALVTIALLLVSCGGGNLIATPTAEPSSQPTIEPTATKPSSPGHEAAQRAAEALAQALGVETSTITVTSVEAVQWPDSCLGIHLPGQACAMHVVAGYQVILEAQGQRYTYRTNGDGSMAVAALALTWHREGGIAGFCDDLVVDQTGAAVAMSCKSGPAQEVGRATLNTQQAGQLQTWLASLGPFEVNQTDQAAADAMTIHLSFDGQGAATASDAEKQAIEAFAAEVYAQTSQGQPGGAGDPARVVSDFLTSLQNDPSGKSSLGYLDQALQANIQSGKPLPQLLGIEGTFRSFGISGTQMEDGNKYALVEVGLNFVSPIERAFELVQEHGSWVIDAFVTYGLPAMNLPAGVASADQVVLGYIHALQDRDAAAAWALLNQAARSKFSEADLAAMAQTAEQISPISIDLTQVSSDQLVYTANLWVTPDPNQPGDWIAGANTRTFYLAQTPDGWLIAQIAKPASTQ